MKQTIMIILSINFFLQKMEILFLFDFKLDSIFFS